MREHPFFFSRNGTRLFGMLYDCQSRRDRLNSGGFVLCPPFAEEKLWSHRVYVSLARALCERGYNVLRFDYTGSGDSEGDFESCTLETYLADIMTAFRELKEAAGIEKAGLMGLRFGATLALLAASSLENCANRQEEKTGPLVLWEPVLDGAEYVRELLKVNLATQAAVYRKIRHTTADLVRLMEGGATVNVDGYELNYRLYRDMIGINLLDGNTRYHGRTLAVRIDYGPGGREKDGAASRFERLASVLGDCEIAGVPESPFWKELPRFCTESRTLNQVTLNWLK